MNLTTITSGLQFGKDDIRFERMDTDKLTMTLYCCNEDCMNKVTKIIFMAGITYKENKGDNLLVCDVNSELKYERFLKSIGKWIGFSMVNTRSSSMFRRYMRNIKTYQESLLKDEDDNVK